MPSLSTYWFEAAEGMIRRAGLRRSQAGRSVVSMLNSFGQLGLKVYFLFRAGPVEVEGQKMDRRTWAHGSFRSTLELLLGRYEPETTRLFHRLLRPGMTVLDVGAHGGYFSLIAASHVGPSGHVYAFEPHPENFAALERNIALNSYANITAFRQAIADRSGKLFLHLNSKGSDRYSLYPAQDGADAESAEVEAITLDDFLAARNWPQVDLLKMDIEGAEPSAIAGMSQALQRGSIRNLVTEFSPPALAAAGCDPQSFLFRLAALGFDVSVLEGQAEPHVVPPPDFRSLAASLRDQGGTNLLCQPVSPGSRRIVERVS